MSSFFCLFQRNGNTPSPEIAERLFQEVIAWPHDQADRAKRGAAAMGQSVRWLSERDRRAELPLVMEISGRSYCFAGDIRLDNRGELLEQFSRADEEASNAELIIRAYLEWGEQAFPDRLLGDFSFALYDVAADTLLCVRDHLGVRPLYYHVNDAFFLVSDSIEVILAHPEVSRELNDRVVAEFALKGWVFNQHETFFTAVRKCPRATSIMVTGSTIGSHEYWNAHAIQPLQYETETEYVEHLRNLLEMVIKERIDSEYPIGAHMSGGLDSSVIATIAGRIWKTERDQPFHTYNWCRPRLGDDPEWHEWRDARIIAQEEGFTHDEIDCSADRIATILLNHDIRLDGTTMYTYERILLPQVQEKGIRLVLSGFGGDEILTARFKDTHIDTIRRGKLITAWKELKEELSERTNFIFPRLLFRYSNLLRNASLPRAFRNRKLSKIIKKRLLFNSSMLKDDFAHYALKNHSDVSLFREETVSKTQYAYIQSGYLQERLESWAALGRKFGIRYAYPYLDKRIVEFALSVPSSCYFKKGHSRHLYRLAVQDFLPPSLLNKRKPSETHRVNNLLKEICKAMSKEEIKAIIIGHDSPYVDNRKFLQQYLEKLQSFEKVQSSEDMFIIDHLRSILLIKML